jgi:hypothetical protein
MARRQNRRRGKMKMDKYMLRPRNNTNKKPISRNAPG